MGGPCDGDTEGQLIAMTCFTLVGAVLCWVYGILEIKKTHRDNSKVIRLLIGASILTSLWLTCILGFIRYWMDEHKENNRLRATQVEQERFAATEEGIRQSKLNELDELQRQQQVQHDRIIQLQAELNDVGSV